MIGISSMQCEMDVASPGSSHDNEQTTFNNAGQENISGNNESVNENAVQVSNFNGPSTSSKSQRL